MILVTVGTHPQGFERLVRPMDELAAGLEERVIIQYGSSRYIPQYAKAFDFAASQEMERLTAEARVVVCHAAAGAIILGLTCSKPLILVPRLKHFGEVMDDHQIQLARALDAQQRALVVYDVSVEYLREAINNTAYLSIGRYDPSSLPNTLHKRLAEWVIPKSG